MTGTYLDEIMAYHRGRTSNDHRDWRQRLEQVHYRGPSFRAAVENLTNPYVKVIAEVKRRSPSKGWIDQHLDAPALASAYQRGGASAISVLTDEPHFAGSRRDLTTVHESVQLPLLRKDFTVSANDVLDAAQMGASAILLIVAALDDHELRHLQEVAQECGVDALVEVHDVQDGRRALASGAALIGVNQRDLRTFAIDTNQAGDVIASLPATVLTVAESGIVTLNDVRQVAQLGFDAVLIGETFVRSANPEQLVHQFACVARVTRG